MARNYVKMTWKDHAVTNEGVYAYTTDGNGKITLTPAFGAVITQGTKLEAVNMQHLEDGIDEAFSELDAHTGDTNNPHGVTLAQIGAAASSHSHSNATTSAAGFMSTTDKSKLNGIESGAQVNTVTGVKGSAQGSYQTGNVNLTAANVGAAASSHSHSNATTSAAGFMSAADKTKLNGTPSFSYSGGTLAITTS